MGITKYDKAMNKRELQKQFQFISKGELEYEIGKNAYKTEKGFLEHLKKLNDSHKLKASLPDIKDIDIYINWKKSRTWGYNPHAKMEVTWADGFQQTYSGFTCSGCGYDKASVVVANALNQVMSGMLYRKRNTRKKAPYGIELGSFFPYIMGGIGMDCFHSIAGFFNGKMRHVSWDDTYDHYNFNFKVKKA